MEPPSEDQPSSKPQSPVKADKPQKAFSCLRCFERKVKCDKQHPCANCTKSNVECIFRIPSAPRRKKKRATEDVLLERLKRAEDLLRSKGITADDSPSSRSTTLTKASAAENPESLDGLAKRASEEAGAGEIDDTKRIDSRVIDALTSSRDNFLSKSPFNSGKLIVSQGRSRFIDNNLWSSVSDEFSQPRDAIANDTSEESDEESLGDDSGDIILGLTPSSHGGIAHLHPTTENLFKLWAIFLDNVNPMTKIIHRPSLEKQIVDATKDLETVPRGLECLMFAIYTCAVGSMSGEDCERTFNESRDVLFKRYRTGCRRALARAKFLGTGDLMVCQSFVLYLLIMREDLDARTIWTLSGVANRISQGLGLHRDGSELGLPVFETEMRRRLWWQLIILDFRSAELTGSGRFGDFWSDTHPPRNVDDIDIWPGITEQEFADRIAAKGENRATEMITTLLRCEFGSFWKEKLIQKSRTDPIMKAQLFTGKPPTPWDSGIKERDETISELERRLEDKFLRYCDVNVPLQFMASIIGRGAIASMRLMAHHPRRWANEADMPQEERNLLWKLSIKLLESDSLVHSTKALQRFMWHTNVYFQWQALVYLLGELKRQTTGDDVDLAWRKVEETYHHHPAFIVEFRKPLHAAVGSLCLKAWEARMRGRAEAEERGEFLMPVPTPDFIAMLTEQRRAPKRKSTGGPLSKQNSLSSYPSNFANNTTGGGFINHSGARTMKLPILTPSTSSNTSHTDQNNTNNNNSSSGWGSGTGQQLFASGAPSIHTANTTYSGALGRMPVDMSSGPGTWDGSMSAGSTSGPPGNENSSSSNLSPYSGGPSQQQQQYTYSPLQAFDPNVGMPSGMLGIGFSGSGVGSSTLSPNFGGVTSGGSAGMLGSGGPAGGGGGGGDILMGDMDWNQWDYLIQDYDVTHHAPGFGSALSGAGGFGGTFGGGAGGGAGGGQAGPGPQS